MSSGTFVVKFKTDAANKTHTLFSMSDKNDGNSYFEVRLQNGNLRLEEVESGQNLMSYTTPTTILNDREWHTIAVSGGNLGGILYVDGKKIFDFTNQLDKFISLVNTPNSMNIGKNVTR